jgi:3-hydroxyacyl-CoA dehydrogenase
VLAGNCFGFIGNRMLEGYSHECSFLVAEGVGSAAEVDQVLTKFGMAMGFFTMR